MKTFLDCVPCLLQQTLHSVRSTTDDGGVHEAIVRSALEAIATMDFRQPPATMAQIIPSLAPGKDAEQQDVLRKHCREDGRPVHGVASGRRLASTRCW